MNRSNSNLDRLLRAASRATPAPLPTDPPLGFEARVLAAWHETRERFQPNLSQVIFKRALICALAVMAAAVGVGLYEMAAPEPTETLLATATIDWAFD